MLLRSSLRAYELVGNRLNRDYRYIEDNRELRRRHPEVLTEIVADIRAVGGRTSVDEETDLLTINGEFTASIVIASYVET